MKFLILFIFILSGCSHFGASKELLKIKFIGDFTLDSSFKFNNKLVGGLSGLVYDDKEKIFLAISDDRSDYDHARIYKLKLVSMDPLEVKVVGQLYLTDQTGAYFKKGFVDFEGITILPSGNLLLSSESIDDKDLTRPPRLMEFSNQGRFYKDWIVKKRYYQKEGEGVRKNKSFESLVYSDGKVYTAVENALIQDDNEPAFQKDTTVRVLEYTSQKDYFTPCKEFAYSLSGLPVDSEKEQGDTGLVELLVYGNSSLLALERSYLYKKRMNVVKLFQFNIRDNVTSDYSLKGKIVENNKRLVFDFAQLGIKLDNIEGMSWGPRLPNGNKTVLFVSDNNFNMKQRSLFLLFEVVP